MLTSGVVLTELSEKKPAMPPMPVEEWEICMTHFIGHGNVKAGGKTFRPFLDGAVFTEQKMRTTD